MVWYHTQLVALTDHGKPSKILTKLFFPEYKEPKKTGKKPGGQAGHTGTTLQKVDSPDKIKEIKVDRRKLPAGNYRQVGFETRQVFDIDISRVVTEYRAQILESEDGRRFVALFPKGVDKAVQYGIGIKVHSVYMSQFQLVPYNRIQFSNLRQRNIYFPPNGFGKLFER